MSFIQLLLLGWVKGKLVRSAAVGLVSAEYIALKDKVFVALFDCIAENDDELSFEKGDTIVKLSDDIEGRSTNYCF